jgi:glyoxylase-like metal-dependent hydrolase (beta-lactamase superfamily II)
MDGDTASLRFPVAAPPPAGEPLLIAPGISWLRMPLPFALDHINLWLVADGPGWTIVDTGYATAETRNAWERIFAGHLEGRPVARLVVTHYHPDHIGLAHAALDHRDGMAPCPDDEPGKRRLCPIAP